MSTRDNMIERAAALVPNRIPVPEELAATIVDAIGVVELVEAMGRMPVPMSNPSEDYIREWQDSYDELCTAYRKAMLNRLQPTTQTDPCAIRWCKSGDPATIRVNETADDGCWSVTICQQCADAMSLKEGDDLPEPAVVQAALQPTTDTEGDTP